MVTNKQGKNKTFFCRNVDKWDECVLKKINLSEKISDYVEYLASTEHNDTFNEIVKFEEDIERLKRKLDFFQDKLKEIKNAKSRTE